MPIITVHLIFYLFIVSYIKCQTSKKYAFLQMLHYMTSRKQLFLAPVQNRPVDLIPGITEHVHVTRHTCLAMPHTNQLFVKEC